MDPQKRCPQGTVFQEMSDTGLGMHRTPLVTTKHLCISSRIFLGGPPSLVKTGLGRRVTDHQSVPREALCKKTSDSGSEPPFAKQDALNWWCTSQR